MTDRTSGEWQISPALTPSELLAAAHLFDGEVTGAGAADALARPGQLFLLAYSRAGRPVGFVSAVEMRHPDREPEMFVNELGVDEPWQRRGIARALLAALAAAARERGCAALWTATEPDNEAALATYRSAGARAEETAVMVEIDLR